MRQKFVYLDLAGGGGTIAGYWLPRGNQRNETTALLKGTAAENY
ncbi:MAG: hypothetical protein ACYS6K_12035 [Planctomycetota bacterium]|jgi:hypothetical protein